MLLNTPTQHIPLKGHGLLIIHKDKCDCLTCIKKMAGTIDWASKYIKVVKR